MLWLDGAVFPDSHAPFDLSDRGLLLGDGVFDTALVLNGRIFRAEAHLRRLIDALATLGIDADRDRDPQGHRRPDPTCRAPRLAHHRHARAGAARARAGGPAKANLMASLSALPPRFFWPRLSMDVAAVRRNETSPLSRLKALSYLDAILAMREAAGKGCNEVLFLNGGGRVACASVGNVFALLGDELVTPPVSDGVLPGVIRGFLLEECGKLGLAARERSLDLVELRAADAVFMTNSLRLIAPVERIGGAAISAKGAEIVEALQQHLRLAIAAECGIEP